MPARVNEAATPPILFRSETLVVRAHLGRGSTALCFVVFDPMVDLPVLDRPAFAEGYLAGLGIDAIHILSSRKDWYQATSLPDALAAVRMRTRAYDRVVAYGSSMGGYAALRFSDQVGAHAVIALSPQYSMTQGLAEPDPRWAKLGAAVTWHHEAPGGRLPAVSEALLIYDPRDPDRLHADLIRRDLPGARTLHVVHGGHPAGSMLSELGVLSRLVHTAARGELDLHETARHVRRGKRNTGAYFFTLARRQPARRLALKARLIDRAMTAAPDDPVFISYAALIQELLGNRTASLALHDAAVAHDYGLGHVRRALACLRANRIGEAALSARRAVATTPPTSNENRTLAAWADDPAEAFRLICNSPWLISQPRPLRWIRLLQDVPPLRRLVGRTAGRPLALALVRRIVSTPAYLGYELASTDKF